ncbi:MAG TPA: dual specificity protein phosphatase family protein [Verrucomicrobiae bacterium]|nr:dual specificity protein phosphatase family protein [Verrucomicrobiae bacterium]
MLRAALSASCLAFCLFSLSAADTNRPATWAVPMSAEGMSNFYKVSDRLYRSAQPTREGIAKLKDLGIRTIVNLRSFHSDRRKIGSAALAYEHLYMKAWHPEKEDIVRFLRLVSDETTGPILVHCQHGADRTGVMCAIYRVAVQGWTKEEALKEMTGGGYHFHPFWHNILTWFNKLDIDKLRKAAGIAAPAK